MDPVIIFMNKHGKPICISRFQLGKLTIFQDFCHDRIIRCQLIQYICCRRISRFRLLSIRKGQMFKKDHAQLLWRIDIEFFPGKLIDFLFQLYDFSAKLFSIAFQFFGFYTHPVLLHVEQGKYKRHLYFCKKLPHFLFFQLFFQNFR